MEVDEEQVTKGKQQQQQDQASTSALSPVPSQSPPAPNHDQHKQQQQARSDVSYAPDGSRYIGKSFKQQLHPIPKNYNLQLLSVTVTSAESPSPTPVLPPPPPPSLPPTEPPQRARRGRGKGKARGGAAGGRMSGRSSLSKEPPSEKESDNQVDSDGENEGIALASSGKVQEIMRTFEASDTLRPQLVISAGGGKLVFEPLNGGDKKEADRVFKSYWLSKVEIKVDLVYQTQGDEQVAIGSKVFLNLSYTFPAAPSSSGLPSSIPSTRPRRSKTTLQMQIDTRAEAASFSELSFERIKARLREWANIPHRKSFFSKERSGELVEECSCEISPVVALPTLESPSDGAPLPHRLPPKHEGYDPQVPSTWVPAFYPLSTHSEPREESEDRPLVSSSNTILAQSSPFPQLLGQSSSANSSAVYPTVEHKNQAPMSSRMKELQEKHKKRQEEALSQNPLHGVVPAVGKTRRAARFDGEYFEEDNPNIIPSGTKRTRSATGSSADAGGRSLKHQRRQRYAPDEEDAEGEDNSDYEDLDWIDDENEVKGKGKGKQVQGQAKKKAKLNTILFGEGRDGRSGSPGKQKAMIPKQRLHSNLPPPEKLDAESFPIILNEQLAPYARRIHELEASDVETRKQMAELSKRIEILEKDNETKTALIKKLEESDAVKDQKLKELESKLDLFIVKIDLRRTTGEDTRQASEELAENLKVALVKGQGRSRRSSPRMEIASTPVTRGASVLANEITGPLPSGSRFIPPAPVP